MKLDCIVVEFIFFHHRLKVFQPGVFDCDIYLDRAVSTRFGDEVQHVLHGCQMPWMDRQSSFSFSS